MNGYISPTSLEALPNELFYYIFSFFDANNLYYSFTNLNTRFNSILRSVPNVYLRFFNQTYEDLKDISQFFASNTKHLCISRTVSYSQQIFGDVKSLTMQFTELVQVQQLQTFTDLKNLVIRFDMSHSIHLRALSKTLLSLLFSENSFPTLEYCKISYLSFLIEMPEVYNARLPMLRSLTLCLSYYKDFDQILITCLNLVSLNIFHNWIDGTSSFPSVTVRHEMLRRLDIIYNYGLTLEHIDHLLEQLPNLKSFALKAYQTANPKMKHPFELFETLAYILKKNVPALRRLHLNVTLDVEYDQKDPVVMKHFQENKLQHVHPLFVNLYATVSRRSVNVCSKS